MMTPTQIRNVCGSLLEIMGDCRLLLPLNETSGTTIADKSRYGHDFTASADVSSWGSTVGESRCLNFVTPKYLSLEDDGDFTFGDGTIDSAFSIFAFIQPGNNILSNVISKYDEINGNYEWKLWFNSTGKLEFRTRTASGSKAVGRMTDYWFSFLSEPAIIAATYDGSASTSGFKIYKDGTRADTSNYTMSTGYTQMGDTAAPVTIGAHGRYTGSISYYFYGKMAWLGVAAKELSADEVWSITTIIQGATE